MRQELEFKRFIDEFGTHYASQTWLGVKLYSEFRFSKNETLEQTENDLKDCATEGAMKLLGIQENADYQKCNIPTLLNNKAATEHLPRFNIITFGSFVVTQPKKWKKQIRKMAEDNTLIPVPLQRKLRPIIELFDNLQSLDPPIEHKSTIITGMEILQWFLPKIAVYCKIMQCHQ